MGWLRRFGGMSWSWERFSHSCPGRGEHSSLCHTATSSLAGTTMLPFPLCTSKPGNPFGRCQPSQEPWRCQPSHFLPSPTTQGLLPPLRPASSLFCVYLHHHTQQDAHWRPLFRAHVPQKASHPTQRVASPCTRAQAASPSPPTCRCWDVPRSTQLPRHQSVSWLHCEQFRTTISQRA